MSDWTGSERQRKPQQPCSCPKAFRGNQRFVSESETRLPSRLNFGRHKGQLLSEVPESYLQWSIATINGREKLKEAIGLELRRRGKKAQ